MRPSRQTRLGVINWSQVDYSLTTRVPCTLVLKNNMRRNRQSPERDVGSFSGINQHQGENCRSGCALRRRMGMTCGLSDDNMGL